MKEQNLKLIAQKRIFPAEWNMHYGCFFAYPVNENLWGRDELPFVQKEFIDFCTQFYLSGEKVFLFAPLEYHLQLEPIAHDIFDIQYGDIWLRDTSRSPSNRKS